MRSTHKTLFWFGLFAVSLFFTPLVFEGLVMAHTDYNYLELSKIKISDEDFCFAVAGDTHIGKYNYSGHVASWLMSEINTKNYEFLIINGDLTHDGLPEQYYKYYKIIQKSKIPVISVIGNHDIRNNGLTNYKATYGEQTYFDFVFEDYQFIIIDNADFLVGADQMNWLERQLNEDYENIVIAHIPPISEANGLQHDDFYDAAHFMTVLSENYPSLVIFSHRHKYVAFENDGIKYIITDAAGGGKAPESYISLCVTDSEIEHKQIFAPNYLFNR